VGTLQSRSVTGSSQLHHLWAVSVVEGSPGQLAAHSPTLHDGAYPNLMCFWLPTEVSSDLHFNRTAGMDLSWIVYSSKPLAKGMRCHT